VDDTTEIGISLIPWRSHRFSSATGGTARHCGVLFH